MAGGTKVASLEWAKLLGITSRNEPYSNLRQDQRAYPVPTKSAYLEHVDFSPRHTQARQHASVSSTTRRRLASKRTFESRPTHSDPEQLISPIQSIPYKQYGQEVCASRQNRRQGGQRCFPRSAPERHQGAYALWR